MVVSRVEPKDLDGLVVQLAFELFALGHLTDSLHEILVDDVVTFGYDGKHASFGADVAQVSAVESVGQLDHSLVVYKLNFILEPNVVKQIKSEAINLPISPRLAIGRAWILRMSKRPCSFGKEISGKCMRMVVR